MSEWTEELSWQGADPSISNLEMDWERLHRLADGNQDFELELLRLFLDDTQMHLEQAKVAIATQDFARLAQAAHHIKGAGGNVGATAIAEAATQLEQQGKQQQLVDETTLLTTIELSLHSIQAYLDTQSA